MCNEIHQLHIYNKIHLQLVHNLKNHANEYMPRSTENAAVYNWYQLNYIVID